MNNGQVLVPMDADIFWQQLRHVIDEALEQRSNSFGTAQVQDTQQLLKVKEVCKLFQISKPTIYEWMRKGQLKSVKIQSRRFFLKSDIGELINSRPGK